MSGVPAAQVDGRPLYQTPWAPFGRAAPPQAQPPRLGTAWSDAKESTASAVRTTGEHVSSMVDQGKEMMSSTSTRVKEAITAGQEAVTQKRHEIEDLEEVSRTKG